MEKLFLSIVTTLVLFTNFSLTAQKNSYYCVFQVKGKPRLNKQVILNKGMFIKPDNTVTMSQDDSLILINQDGVFHKIHKKGIISYEQIKDYNNQKKQSSFTLDYLKYVWKRLWEREKKQNIGVVYRSGNNMIKKLKPADSTLIEGPTVEFKWEGMSDNEVSYFYLKEKKTGRGIEIRLKENRLVLTAQKNILNTNSTYLWTVENKPDIKPKDDSYSEFKIIDGALRV